MNVKIKIEVSEEHLCEDILKVWQGKVSSLFFSFSFLQKLGKRQESKATDFLFLFEEKNWKTSVFLSSSSIILLLLLALSR